MKTGIIKKCLGTIVAIAAIVVSCDNPSNEGTGDTNPSIRISPVELSIPATGGQSSLTLNSNMAWSVTEVPEWLSVDPQSGDASLDAQEIVLSATENTGALREAVLTFLGEEASCEARIKQASAFGSDAPENALFFESFKSGSGKFSINDVKLTGPVTKVWEHTTQYSCMKATAYVNNASHESESWLVSPEIDLTNQDAAYFTFEHAGMYFGDITKEATVWVSKDSGDWEQLFIEDDDYPSSWDFLPAGEWDLAPYLGGKVRFGFKFISSVSRSGTWEIRNVAVISGAIGDNALPSVDPTKVTWLELPEMDGDGLQYFTHRFKMNDQIYRNYTFAWSQKDLLSVWVAYPLCSVYTDKNVERTDAWAYDPYLGKALSSAPFSYYAGDYDRGHQLPSADRLCCSAANRQTFYGTNIVPQLKGHNEGIWGDLEAYVRNSIANNCDSTYVVNGCVVDGATEFSTDSDNKAITIPVAFFKAVLRYEKGASAEWAAVAFYTEHKDYGAEIGIKDVAMSVDALEEKLGMDFFVHLVDKLGADQAAAVEAQDPNTSSHWNFK